MAEEGGAEGAKRGRNSERVSFSPVIVVETTSCLLFRIPLNSIFSFVNGFRVGMPNWKGKKRNEVIEGGGGKNAEERS